MRTQSLVANSLATVGEFSTFFALYVCIKNFIVIIIITKDSVRNSVFS